MPQKIRCRVVEIQDHGERVYSVFLQPESPALTFLPGQYLDLALDEYRPGGNWPESRSFSIASASSDHSFLRITYAVKGQFSTRMEAELRTGCPVWVKMPYGEFIVDTSRDACLLAGGTGVTAFTAFLDGLSATYPQHVHLFYGARRPGQLIYRPLVQATAQRCPGLQVRYFAEQDFDGTDCLPGRIEAETVFNSVPEPLSLTYYLAGPPAMVQALTMGLIRREVEPGKIIAEAWE
jgi:ferredoxin-NADP reductase